jgi:hypothetical protein
LQFNKNHFSIFFGWLYLLPLRDIAVGWQKPATNFFSLALSALFDFKKQDTLYALESGII